MKKILFINIFLSLLFISSCGNQPQQTTSEEESKDLSLIEVTQEQFNTMKMELSPLQEHEFDVMVKASGKVDVPPQKRAKVSSFMEGYVKSSNLLIGDKVNKGQALATLENPEYINLQQDYLETANQLVYLKSEYERQKTLFEEKIASQKRYLEAENDYKKSKAVYDGLRKKLQLLNINPDRVENGELTSTITIYAPISGEITAINVNVGMAIAPTDIIAEIIDTKALHLELSVNEKDFFLIKEGQTIQFTIPQVSDNEFESKISLVSKSVEKDSRVITVYGTLADTVKQKLLAGMFVETKIITDSKNVQSVPYDAVVSEESNNFLLVLESDSNDKMVFRKTMVKTGERNGDWVEIISNGNINEKSQILIKGVYDVI